MNMLTFSVLFYRTINEVGKEGAVTVRFFDFDTFVSTLIILMLV